MSDDDGGEQLPPHDRVGCALLALRTGCLMAALQILMALAIIAAAILSLFLFR